MFKLFVLNIIIGVTSAQRPINHYSSPEAMAQITTYTNNVNVDGSYKYAFETTNGISQQEEGVGGHHVQGSSSYISPEGVPIFLTYTADENGFRPQGDHIPRVPEYILRSLDWIAAQSEEPDFDIKKH